MEKENGTTRSSPSLGNHAVRSPSCPHRGSGTRRRGSRASSSSSIAACTCARIGSVKCSRRRFSAWRLTCITDSQRHRSTRHHSKEHVAHLESDRASNMHERASKVQLYDGPPFSWIFRCQRGASAINGEKERVAHAPAARIRSMVK